MMGHVFAHTCLDLVLESVLAVHQQLVEVEWLVRDGEVYHLLELVRAVEVDDLGRPVVLDRDVVQEDLHHGPQELPGLGIRLLGVACLTYRPQL